MEYYENGDQVFYKFGTDPRWHGPGKVIGTDNKIVFLRHGGNIISMSQSRIMNAKPSEKVSTVSKERENVPSRYKDRKKVFRVEVMLSLSQKIQIPILPIQT